MSRPLAPSYTIQYGATNLINHPGLGGQDVHVDVKNKLVFVYLTNGLKEMVEGNDLSDKLLDRVYDAITKTKT